MKLTVEQVEEAIGPIEGYAHQCHAASIALVKSGLLGESRVARGTCRGVSGQHSWAVVGMDCYDEDATIVDLTAWSYDMDVPRVWVTTMAESPHRPHGWGKSLISWGCPTGGGGEHIDLTPTKPFGHQAKFWVEEMFPNAVGNLDRRFWSNLVNHAPMVGWPAGEVIAAMADTPEVAALVPIDLLGMLTDRNPSGMYLAKQES